MAWTRAEEELHAFLTETPNSRNTPGLGHGLDILLDALSMSGDEWESGTPPLVKAAGRSAPPRKDVLPALFADAVASDDAAWRPMHWLPRLRIFRNPLEDFSFTRKRRGIFAHHCLECLQTLGQLTGHPEEDARRAFRQGLRTFPLPVHDPQAVEEEVVDMLAWYASLPEAETWLRHGTPEQEIVDASGALYRADLVVNDGEKITVVEYKTGTPTVAHQTQLRGYMDLLATASALPVQGVLVYLDLKRLERFSP